MLFRERAFWMYLTGHRLGDMRRLIRQYGRAGQHRVPDRHHRPGRPYGTDVNFEHLGGRGQQPELPRLSEQKCLRTEARSQRSERTKTSY